ncbi:MAG: hypothetical protein O7H39_10155 [Gammaproteobacteria bacterium]|nr:hypothetical protein [Gammaproteobacteria bacterium]
MKFKADIARAEAEAILKVETAAKRTTKEMHEKKLAEARETYRTITNDNEFFLELVKLIAHRQDSRPFPLLKSLPEWYKEWIA